MSNVQKWKCSWSFVQKFSLEEHLTLFRIIVCFPLNPFSIMAWRKVEEEKGNMRKRVNIFHWVGFFLH